MAREVGVNELEMRVSDYVFQTLAKAGVKHVFLVPGGAAMWLGDSLARNRKIKPVACLHEQGASIAAEAYAQFTGNLGACMVTSGPGGANAITGCWGAYVESTPMLVISGTVKTNDIKELGFQEAPIVDMVRPITKYATTVLYEGAIRRELEKCLWTKGKLERSAFQIAQEHGVGVMAIVADLSHPSSPDYVAKQCDALKVSTLVNNGNYILRTHA